MFSLIRFGLKAAIATSAVYITVDSGVWKESETTAVLYDSITSQANELLEPYLKKVPFPDIPRTGSVLGTTQNVWNTGVKASCKFLVGFPACASAHIKRYYKYAEEQILAATSVPPSS